MKYGNKGPVNRTAPLTRMASQHNTQLLVQHMAGVAKDATRFNHALIGLNEEAIEIVLDVLEEYS